MLINFKSDLRNLIPTRDEDVMVVIYNGDKNHLSPAPRIDPSLPQNISPMLGVVTNDKIADTMFAILPFGIFQGTYISC